MLLWKMLIFASVQNLYMAIYKKNVPCMDEMFYIH